MLLLNSYPPNRRSKGRDATSIITPHVHGYLCAYRNTLNMANRDLNRLKSCACREKRTNRWLAALKSIFGKQILKKKLEKSNKSRIFAALESATLPIEQRTRAELFVYMRMEYML